METSTSSGTKLKSIGEILIRFSLVAILLWVGALKFVQYEAEAIKPLVENSGLTSWGYNLMSVGGFSKLIGVVEILLGLLIASRFFSPMASAIGSMGAVIMFIITLSFLLTTPGAWQAGHGFPFPSPMPGQFLAKDLMLLSVSIWTAGEALIAAKMKRN